MTGGISLDLRPLAVQAPAVEPAMPNLGAAAHAEAGGTFGELTGLLVKGHLLTLLTLGIYRFWVKTQLRRWYWSNTILDGDRFEYAGTGRELLIGFLFALGILLPLYSLLVGGAFFTGLVTPAFAGKLFLVVFIILAQFAHYRARRYRMTRTVWRGLRFSQTGRGIVYAAYAVAGGVLMLATLGLATPFVRAALEGYKIRHTRFGSASGAFNPRLVGVVTTWLVLWLPVLLAFGGTLYWVWTRDGIGPVWEAVQLFLGLTENLEAELRSEAGASIAILGGGAAVAFVWAALLWPAYKTVEFRAFGNGTRIGPVEFECKASLFYLYWATIRMAFMSGVGFACLSFVLGIVGAAVGAMVVGFLGSSGKMNDTGTFLLIAIGAVLGYFLIFVMGLIMNEVIVKQGFWKHVIQRTTIRGLEQATTIVVLDRDDSAIGEGLTDALDGIGFG